MCKMGHSKRPADLSPMPARPQTQLIVSFDDLRLVVQNEIQQ
jgi:hypothetical protein